MRKVVDSNFLRSRKLREYLSRSKNNIAVITDYTELEMVKAGGLDGLLKSTEVIADFPRQIVLAKATDVAAALRGRRKGLKKRLTDGKRTGAFRKWCRTREQIKRGEKPFDLERAQAEAAAHVEAMVRGAASIKDDLIAHAKNYTDEELRILKDKKPLPPDLVMKIIDGVLHFTRKFYEAEPDTLRLPPAEQLPYTFIFRFALCAYMHALRWIVAGGAGDRKMEKFGNDMVDVAMAAYGTCFDGVMTEDKQTAEIYDNAMFLIDKVILPHWKENETEKPKGMTGLYSSERAAAPVYERTT